MNCLVPEDHDIRVTAQQRNYEQSVYLLSYTHGGIRPLTLAWWRDIGSIWVAAATLILLRLALYWRQRRGRAGQPTLEQGGRTNQDATENRQAGGLLAVEAVSPDGVQRGFE